MQVATQRVDLAAGLADDDARARRVDVDLHLVGVLADRDLRDARVREAVLDVRTDRDVLRQVVGEVLLGEPMRLPVVDVPHAHGLGMDLLSHVSSLLLGRERDREVAGALADRRGATHRPRAKALEGRTLVSGDRVDAQLFADQLVVVLGVGDGRLQQLLPVLRDVRAACARGSRGPPSRTCRGCGRRRGGPCGPTCGRTWPGRGRPAPRPGRAAGFDAFGSSAGASSAFLRVRRGFFGAAVSSACGLGGLSGLLGGLLDLLLGDGGLDRGGLLGSLVLLGPGLLRLGHD